MKVLFPTFFLSLFLIFSQQSAAQTNGISDHQAPAVTPGARMACDTLYSFPVLDPWPTGIAWDGRNFWSAGSILPTIYKYRTSGVIAGSIPNPSSDYGVGSLEFIDGNLWALAEQEDIIYELDTATGAVISQINLPLNTENWGLTYDGTNLFVCNYVDNTLFKVNPDAGQIFDLIHMPTAVIEIKFIEGTLYGITRNFDYLCKIDTSNGVIIDSIEWCIPYPLGITWDGGHLWNISSDMSYGGLQRAFKMDVQGFITSAAHEPVVQRISELKVSPSPMAERGVISFETIDAMPVTIALFDCLGRKVKTLLDKELGSGKHRIPLESADIPSGIYFIEVYSGGNRRAIKFAVAH